MKLAAARGPAALPAMVAEALADARDAGRGNLRRVLLCFEAGRGANS